MDESVYLRVDEALARRRRELAAESHKAFSAFSRQVFAAGALSVKVKQLIAVAVAHVTQCPYCIESHTQLAVKQGASDEEIMEAIWVAAEMRLAVRTHIRPWLRASRGRPKVQGPEQPEERQTT